MFIFYACIFFLGAAIASFLNATLYRIDKKYKYPQIITQGSHCENCKNPLSWWKLIPILGYILTLGKCKSCGKRINPYYPISELLLGLTGLFFVLYSVPYYFFVLSIFLFILSYYDFKDMGIPKNITHIFLGICAILFVFNFNLPNLLLPLVITLVFLILNLIKKSFGMGDILIILGLGILLTKSQFIIFFWISILLALLYSLGFIMLKKIKLKGAKVPMVPFLSVAFVVSVLYGETLFTTLLNFMGI